MRATPITSLAVAGSILLAASAASAQQPAPPNPTPEQQPPVQPPLPSIVPPAPPPPKVAPSPPRFSTVDEAMRQKGFSKRENSRWGLVVAGSILTGTMYLVGFVATGTMLYVDKSAGEVAPMFAPVVGPFITAITASSRADVNNRPSVGEGVALMADGILQVAGVAMFITGFAAKESSWVKQMGKTIPYVIPGNQSVALGWQF